MATSTFGSTYDEYTEIKWPIYDINAFLRSRTRIGTAILCPASRNRLQPGLLPAVQPLRHTATTPAPTIKLRFVGGLARHQLLSGLGMSW